MEWPLRQTGGPVGLKEQVNREHLRAVLLEHLWPAAAPTDERSGDQFPASPLRPFLLRPSAAKEPRPPRPHIRKHSTLIGPPPGRHRHRPRLTEFDSPLPSPPATPRSLTSVTPPASLTMMEVNVVPSVVLHFHGFRSSLLSTLGDAARHLVLSMAQRSLLVSLFALAMLGLRLLVVAALRRLMHAGLVYAAFLACEALAVKYANKRSAFLLGARAVDAAPPAEAAVPTLPRLQLPASIAVLPVAAHIGESSEHRKFVGGDLMQVTPKVAATPSLLPTLQPPHQLSAVRRRVAVQLRAPIPGVNIVPQERRRRADMSLHSASIRVGKAFLDPIADEAIARGEKKRKQVDIYMVRVDCSKPDDKHMNPVVMWDVTATFEEFRKLEKDLRAEVKAKKLRFVEVPHLSSGAILFVQPELTQDVLAKRRARLQRFVEALRADRTLADSDTMRKFCQAY